MNEDINAKAIIGGVLFSLILIFICYFISNKHSGNIKKNGIYVIAKKIKWESAEAVDGIAFFEFYINGNKISEKAYGCGAPNSAGSYFVIQYYSEAFTFKIDYLCSDSISYLKIKDIDIKKTWNNKPIELLSSK